LVIGVRRFIVVLCRGHRAGQVAVGIAEVVVEQCHDDPQVTRERAELGRYANLRSSLLHESEA